MKTEFIWKPNKQQKVEYDTWKSIDSAGNRLMFYIFLLFLIVLALLIISTWFL